ncbi:MAG: hypothetical protein JKY15_05595 [Deltaproteobacteria bacterium]|nr:hypothetical protein [Deltaproteobacteria bacterium]
MGCLLFSFGALADIGAFDLRPELDIDVPELPRQRVVHLMPEKVFIPKGFDSNDSSEVIISGWYPNPCYEPLEAEVIKENGQIFITPRAKLIQRSDRVCIAMAVPYVKSIKLGMMKPGLTKISMLDIWTGHLEVEPEGKDSIDDHLYGKVTHVRSGDKALFVEIEQPSSCITFDSFKFISNNKDTCAVLPIMKQVQRVCPKDPRVFEYRFDIPAECQIAEKVLFHIRSLGGESVNHIHKDRNF